MKNKINLTIAAVFTFLFVGLRGVAAQSFQVVDGGSQIGLQPIKLPFFLNPSQISAATPFTYITLALNLVYVGIMLMWVFYIVRSAVQIMQSQGDSKVMETATKKIQNVFAGAASLFLFFAVLSLVGAFFGIGNFFEWPKSFSKCQNGEYYFEVVLSSPQIFTETSGANVDSICFGS